MGSFLGHPCGINVERLQTDRSHPDEKAPTWNGGKPFLRIYYLACERRTILGREKLAEVRPQHDAIAHQLQDKVRIGFPVFRFHNRWFVGRSCQRMTVTQRVHVWHHPSLDYPSLSVFHEYLVWWRCSVPGWSLWRPWSVSPQQGLKWSQCHHLVKNKW